MEFSGRAQHAGFRRGNGREAAKSRAGGKLWQGGGTRWIFRLTFGSGVWYKIGLSGGAPNTCGAALGSLTSGEVCTLRATGPGPPRGRGIIGPGGGGGGGPSRGA